jgi:hypothetical protein
VRSVTQRGAEHRGTIVGRKNGIVCCAQCPDRPWVVSGVQGILYTGDNRPGCETDLSPLPNTEDNNALSYTSISPYVLITQFLIKHKKEFRL